MRREIERATTVLIGKVLLQCNRAADLAAFHFAIRPKVQSRGSDLGEVGEYSLHVQCPWRITRADQVVVGSSDLYYRAKVDPANSLEDFDWDREPNRRDELLRDMFEKAEDGFLVQELNVGEAGSLHIVMAGGLSLDVFPNDSVGGEHWRLFNPSSNDPHLVVGGEVEFVGEGGVGPASAGIG
jgi:hypothetical protein